LKLSLAVMPMFDPFWENGCCQTLCPAEYLRNCEIRKLKFLVCASNRVSNLTGCSHAKWWPSPHARAERREANCSGRSLTRMRAVAV
ncbi:Unknown protein, partial [Striga hermonthica]